MVPVGVKVTGIVLGVCNLLVSLATLGEELSWVTREIHCDTSSENKSHHVLSKFMILCWATFTATPGCMRPVGRRLDTSGYTSLSVRSLILSFKL